MKKLCFCDADDVFLQWIPDFNEHLASLGYDLGPQPREYIPLMWGYPEVPGLTYPVVESYIQSGPSHPPYIEMINTLKKLRSEGWEVIIITSHPTNKMMERISNIAAFGQFYDHIVFSLSYGPDGKPTSLSKAQYIKNFYKETSLKIFIDDRLKSVNEFVELGLGVGFSMERAYNSEDLKKLQENPLLSKRTFLGRGKTMKDQVLDLIPQIESVTEHLTQNVVVAFTSKEG